MEIINGQRFEGERSLFRSSSLDIRDSVFGFGESPLKESKMIRLTDCTFEWKYPLWYSEGISAKGTKLEVGARAGIWYTKNISMNRCDILAPKTFRRSEGILLKSVRIPNADETMWSCRDINLYDVTVRGDYFGMNCIGVNAEKLDIEGGYAFDGAMNVILKNSRLISKDVFWNAENVIVYDSVIVGEYIGWNSKNIKFINCKIESNQGFCYMDNVVLENCELTNTDLAFEYSTVNADIRSSIVSIKNPISGKIMVDSVGEIIIDEHKRGDTTAEIIIRENT